jgi:hypothetical protein
MVPFVDDDELCWAAFSVEQPLEIHRADFDRVVRTLVKAIAVVRHRDMLA